MSIVEVNVIMLGIWCEQWLLNVETPLIYLRDLCQVNWATHQRGIICLETYRGTHCDFQGMYQKTDFYNLLSSNPLEWGLLIQWTTSYSTSGIGNLTSVRPAFDVDSADVLVLSELMCQKF